MPSMFQLRAIHYLKRTAFLLLFLAIAVGLYYAVQTDAWRNTMTKMSSSMGGNTKSTEPAETGTTDTFEEKLERSTVQQLILQATQLIDELGISPVERLERQHYKVQIAEMLIQREDSSRAVNFGVATKLSALRTRELINFDNGLSSNESLDELRQFSQRYLSSFDEDTLRQANLGQLTVAIVEELLKSDAEGFVMAPEVLRSFETICKKYDNDIIVAEEFFKFLQRIHIHAPEVDRDKFLKVYGDVFENSRVEKIKIMASDVYAELVESEFSLVNIFDVIETQRNTAIQELRNEIKEVIDRGYISQYGYYKIFESLKDVARAGDYAIALELVELLEDNIRGKATLSKLAAECLPFKKRLRYVGQKFTFDGVLSTSGDSFKQRIESAPLKAVFFSDGENNLIESNQFLFSITRAAGRDIAKDKFCISAVVSNRSGVEVAKSRIEKMERLVPSVDFAILDMESENGKKLSNDLSLSNTMLLILLDDQNKVVGIGIEKPDIEATYKRLKNR